MGQLKHGKKRSGSEISICAMFSEKKLRKMIIHSFFMFNCLLMHNVVID